MKNKNSELSDEDYWKQFGSEIDSNKINHDMSLEISTKFFGLNGEIYETKEKDISCNPESLNTFLSNLKKQIRMLDESVSDKSPLN